MQERASGTKRLQGPRCSATTKAGKPCQALAGSDGKCSAHSGRQDMRALGSRGGRSRHKSAAEQLPEAERASLREQLRRGLDPEVVVRTANEILAGENQTARGNMIRFLADLELYKQGADECPRCAAVRAEGPAARAKVNEWIARLVESAVRQEFSVADEQHDSEAMKLVREAIRRGIAGHEEALEAAIEAAFGRVLDSISRSSGIRVDKDVTAEQAAEVIEMLVEAGVLDWKVEELAQKRAEELTRAFREEHGLPMPSVA